MGTELNKEQEKNDVETCYIDEVEIDKFFYEISSILLGKSIQEIRSNYDHDLASLVYAWETQGFIEIYHLDKDAQYTRIKPSHIDSNGTLNPWYINIYHARVEYHKNDPLIVITFEPTGDNKKIPIVKFLIDHDGMFGKYEEKFQKEILDKLHKIISELTSNPREYKNILAKFNLSM